MHPSLCTHGKSVLGHFRPYMIKLWGQREEAGTVPQVPNDQNIGENVNYFSDHPMSSIVILEVQQKQVSISQVSKKKTSQYTPSTEQTEIVIKLHMYSKIKCRLPMHLPQHTAIREHVNCFSKVIYPLLKSKGVLISELQLRIQMNEISTA